MEEIIKQIITTKAVEEVSGGVVIENTVRIYIDKAKLGNAPLRRYHLAWDLGDR